MANTRPNIIIPAETVVDLYAATAAHPDGVIAVGTKISTRMIGNGEAKLYAGVTLAAEPTDSTGFFPLYQKETATNDAGDTGAFIWSREGCTVNVREV